MTAEAKPIGVSPENHKVVRCGIVVCAVEQKGTECFYPFRVYAGLRRGKWIEITVSQFVALRRGVVPANLSNKIEPVRLADPLHVSEVDECVRGKGILIHDHEDEDRPRRDRHGGVKTRARCREMQVANARIPAAQVLCCAA